MHLEGAYFYPFINNNDWQSLIKKMDYKTYS